MNNHNIACPRNAMTLKPHTTKGRTTWDQAAGFTTYLVLSPIEQDLQSMVKSCLPNTMLLQAAEVVT